MPAIGRSSWSTRAAWWVWAGLVATAGSTGCVATSTCPSCDRDPAWIPAGPPLTAPIAAIVDAPRPDDDFEVAVPASAVETWIVHTRACEQAVDTNPWPCMTVARLDEQGGPLRGSEPGELFARMPGRPVVVLVHGAGYTYRASTNEAMEVRGQLEALGGLTPDSVFVVFDWPSEREKREIIADLNEKSRRSRVAGYHLARLLQAAPPSSTVCLMGQSDGGRASLTALHLLSGAELRPLSKEPGARLTSGRPDLRLRCVALDTAAAHHWLNPGDRLGGALPTSEAVLNLRNSRDFALAVFDFGRYTGRGPALGRVGLTAHDRAKLGPLAARVEQYDLHPLSGNAHTLFPQALTYPGVARRIADYTSWGDLAAGRGLDEEISRK